MLRRFTSRDLERNGFSLVELLIVLAIVLALMTIALPQLLRAREIASEAAADGALRTIHLGQLQYFILYQGYAPSLRALGPPPSGQPASAEAADFIDEQLAAGQRGRYRFRYGVQRRGENGLVTEYLVVAEPLGETARRARSIDQSGTIRKTENTENTKSGKIGSQEP